MLEMKSELRADTKSLINMATINGKQLQTCV